MGRSRSLNKLFADAHGSPLAEIIAKTAKLKSLEQQILDHLPSALRPQIELAEADAATLTLICTSSVVANRLRFMETELLKKFNSDDQLPGFQKLRAIVSKDWQPVTRTDQIRETEKRISDTSAQLIEQTSNVVNNPRLAQALKRLARSGSHDNDQAAE